MKITQFIDKAFDIVTEILIPLAFSLTILYFFWGIFKYIKEGATSDKAAEEGKRIMLWGVAGIFVAFSIWGIISFIQSELNIDPIIQIQTQGQ